VLKPQTGKQVSGSSDTYEKTTIKEICHDLCSNDTRCVMAWHDTSKCFMYYNRHMIDPGNADNTVYEKVQETSTGV